MPGSVLNRCVVFIRQPIAANGVIFTERVRLLTHWSTRTKGKR